MFSKCSQSLFFTLMYPVLAYSAHYNKICHMNKSEIGRCIPTKLCPNAVQYDTTVKQSVTCINSSLEVCCPVMAKIMTLDTEAPISHPSLEFPSPTFPSAPPLPLEFTSPFTPVESPSPPLEIPSTTSSTILTSPSPSLSPLPPVPSTTSPPIMRSSPTKSMQKCDEYHGQRSKRSSVNTYIIHGKPSLAKTFPHMAALGYGSFDTIQWFCGGSLISEQYVLTAAHCLHSQTEGDVQWVRLGDLNLRSTDDDADPQTYSVLERIPHPEYALPAKYNDIALLKLDQTVKFSAYVQPICLPASEDITVTSLVATGWGITEVKGPQSDILMEVTLDYFPNDICQQSYTTVSTQELPSGILPDKQICAGSIDDSKDTCQGDSGGPLQITTDRLYLVGITPFGRSCGLPNIPAVYTKVFNYIPWIEQIVWAD